MAKKTFYIIDGHAHIYRAYFAPFRELTSPTGEPTKATFVFTQMLLNLAAQRQPDYLAVVIDTGSGTEDDFRTQIYPEYKANREAKPADLAVQETRIIQIIKDAGIPLFFKQGVEADDLIATMTRRLEDSGWEIFLVSKDKDLRQLIDDSVRMFDAPNNLVIDAAAMEAKVGYTPAQAVEVQTLMGDKIDNVPGIPGVGEMTAAKLIKKYGKADAILQHLDDLTPKMRENFEKFGDRLPLTRQLVTLKRDVEFEFDPEACRFKGMNTPALREILLSLGFSSLAQRLGGSAPAAPVVAPVATVDEFRSGLFDMAPAGPAVAVASSVTATAVAPAASVAVPSTVADCCYTLIDTEEKFAELLTEMRKQTRIAFDTETDDLGPMLSNIVGMSFSWKAATGYYVPVRGPLGAKFLNEKFVLDAIKPILEDRAIGKVGHNIKYDMLVMRRLGIRVQGVALDTMIAAFLLDASRINPTASNTINERRKDLDRLALGYLNYRKIPTADMLGRGKNRTSMDRVPLEEITNYASEDADITFRLAKLLDTKLDEVPTLRKLCDEVETPLIDVLVEMEFNGIAIDPAVLKEQSEVMGKRIEELHEKIMSTAGCNFNPDSPKQLADVLFNKLGLKVVKRTKTGASTDIEVLEKLADLHECPRLLIQYRSLQKLKNTYLDNLTEYRSPMDQRIHANFNQSGAATGRLSCSDPNLQNIPIRTDEGRRIRLAFVTANPERDVLLTADYSQIELRILAHFTEEPALMRAFAADEDVHSAVASEVFGVPLDKVSREQRAQAKIINFGIIYGVSPFGLARRIEGMTVPAARELIANYNKRFPSIHRFLEQCVQQAQQGYVETILGRRRPVTELDSGVLSIRNAGERIAINSVVQGSAADLIKMAMLNVHNRLKKEKSPAKMLIQVHDELVFETPADAVEATAKIVTEEMTGAMTLKVPLKVEVGWGKNWQEVK